MFVILILFSAFAKGNSVPALPEITRFHMVHNNDASWSSEGTRLCDVHFQGKSCHYI